VGDGVGCTVGGRVGIGVGDVVGFKVGLVVGAETCREGGKGLYPTGKTGTTGAAGGSNQPTGKTGTGVGLGVATIDTILPIFNRRFGEFSSGSKES